MVLHNLYLLSSEQLEHIISIQKAQRGSYEDKESNQILTELKNPTLIVNKLLESEGFELERYSPEGYDCDYEKVIPHDDIYCLYVNVSLKDRKVYFYDEYDCGGKINSYITEIPEDIDLFGCSFLYWLRSKIEECI